MAISFVGGTTGTGTGASYSVSLAGTLTGGSATSPAPGDLIVVYTGFGNTASSAPTCSGNASGAYVGAHAALHVNDTWDTEFRTFYQFAGASPDTALTIGRLNNAAYGGATVVLVFRDVGSVTATTASGGNGAAVNPPSVTPTRAGSWIVAGGTGMLAAADTAGMTAISNLTAVRSAYGDGSTSDASTIAGYYDGWTSGAFDPAAATGGNLGNGSSSWAASTLVLAPPNPSLSTVTEDFEVAGSLENSKWNVYVDTGGTVTATDGEAVLTPFQGNGYYAILYSDANFGKFRLDSDGAYVKLTQRLTTANNVAGGNTEFHVYDWSGGQTNTYLAFRVSTAGALIAETVNAGTVSQSQTISTTWDTDNTPWLKISLLNGTATWWTASGGANPGTWTSRHTNSSLPSTFSDALLWFAAYNDNWTATGALTGAAKFDGVNTAANSTATNVPLTGQSLTASRGSPEASAPVALAGQAVTVSRGSITPAGGSTGTTSATLTGQAMSAARGAVGVDGQKVLSGFGLTTASGLTTAAAERVLAGHALTSARGSFASVSSEVGLSGLSAAASGGALGTLLGQEAPLAGQAVSTATGSLGAHISTSDAEAVPVGQACQVAAGFISVHVEYVVALSGVAATVATQPVAGSSVTEVDPAGHDLAADTGTLAPHAQIPLTGQSATTARGSVGHAITSNLIGRQVDGAVGAFAPSAAHALSGRSTSVGRGSLTAILFAPLNGHYLAANAGDPQSLDEMRRVVGKRARVTNVAGHGRPANVASARRGANLS